jgi:uncharacterized protein
VRTLSVFIGIFLLTSLMVPNPSAARSDEQPRTISVSGSGMVAVTPDMATVRVGVSSRDASPAKALKDNTARVTKLFKTLDTFGLEKRDIQTSSFNVNPVYTRRRPPNTPPVIEAYDVTNMVTLRLRNLDKLGALLEALVIDGANRLNGLSFGVSKPEEQLDQARKLAIKDAKRKAKLYAKEADVDVGDVLKISENGSGRPRPQMFKASRMSAEAAPVAAGEQQISASVSVIFEID